MPISWDIEVFSEINSTQDVCKARAMEGGAEGSVIQALSQTQGKGRHGREWVSAAGNLAFSFILRPHCDVSHIGQLSILVGVALAKTIGAKAQLKWPNDILVEGQKCAGILIDSDLSGQIINWLVVGLGVNTSSAPEGAYALQEERDQFLQDVLAQISELYEDYKRNGFEDIRQYWLHHSFEKGTPLNVGAFEDLDDFGNLVVRDAQNQL
ncbi:MAG: biotin--[acetyl-CoA-carboxylase] ligase, partial [Pseudomonadota bacterium]